MSLAQAAYVVTPSAVSPWKLGPALSLQSSLNFTFKPKIRKLFWFCAPFFRLPQTTLSSPSARTSCPRRRKKFHKKINIDLIESFMGGSLENYFFHEIEQCAKIRWSKMMSGILRLKIKSFV